MSVFRSYFKQNASLIKFIEINNSQNPVTEISYGTLNQQISRFIFSIDLTALQAKIASGQINPTTISKHILRMTNTIAYRPDLCGKKSYDEQTDRASSFDLDLFNIDEEWDEGSGYDFTYVNNIYPVPPTQAVNWYNRKTNTPWYQPGAFITGATGMTGGSSAIIGTQHFVKGNENLEIDITGYINHLLQLSGTTGYTGTSYGLGLKFATDYEVLETDNRQAVAFHTKYTNTYFEPFIETVFEDTITDDRNYFYMDKDNSLYLYSNVGNGASDVTVSAVTIFDHNGDELFRATSSAIEHVKKGVYKLGIFIGSNNFPDIPDSVLFTDRWTVVQDGRVKEIDQEFYLLPSENYFSFSLDNRINFDDFYITYSGIKSNESLKSGSVRRINVKTKSLYSQDSNLPLDMDYRVYTTQSDKYQIDIVPFTKVDRTSRGYEFTLDTSWLIPQEYFLEIRMNNGDEFAIKSPIRFNIVDNGLF